MKHEPEQSPGPPPVSSQQNDRRPLRVLLFSMWIAFLVVRAALHLFPASNFTVAGYNVHHLFTGFLLVAAAAIPLALGRASGRIADTLLVVLGAGLALVLDEWIYLIVTDGSDLAYLTPPSYLGALAMMLLASMYAWLISRR